MKRILISLGTVSAVLATAVFATNAFFTDVETSTGNTFTAGDLNLQLTNNSTSSTGVVNAGDKWSTYGDIGNKVLMNYSDIKPGDYGENSIAIKVASNNAWACIRAYNIVDDDNGQTPPEALVETTPSSGDLSNNLNFIWWVDTNGNNSLDTNEQVMFGGPVTLATIRTQEKFTIADSTWNAFTFSNSGPLVGNAEYKLGIGWCLGSITENRSVAPGFTCNGASVGNQVQSDKVTGTFEFNATQSRNQLDYKCPEHQG